MSTNLCRLVPAIAIAALGSLAVAPLAAAKKAPSVHVAVPAKGEASVLLAGVRQRHGQRLPRLAVKGAPAGTAVLGGVTRGGVVAIAVVRPRASASTARAAGKGTSAAIVELRSRGRRPQVRGARVATSVLGTPGKRGPACADPALGATLGRGLAPGAGIAGDDAKGLGALLARRVCGGELSAADIELLSRLGLRGAVPVAGAGPSASIGTLPDAAAGAGGGRNAGPQCSNGIDDDGDGQVDHLGSGSTRPDPGCTDANDGSETGEVPVAAACGQSSGISQSPDNHASLFLGVNSGCGQFTRVWVNVAPAARTCQAITSDSTFDCTPSNGNALATARDGKAIELIDIPLELSAAADCSVPATVALYRPGGEVAELVEPIGPCAGAPPSGAQCANGRDDDGDGQTDARQTPGATDPDPGCSDGSDDSEDSEVDLPSTCSVQGGSIDGNPQFPGIVTNGCGTLVGAWFKPSAQPTGCAFRVGTDAAQSCAVVGGVGEASFPATTAGLLLGTPTATPPTCAPVTIALLRSDGSVAEGRANWC